jgi:hypothetical protein
VDAPHARTLSNPSREAGVPSVGSQIAGC